MINLMAIYWYIPVVVAVAIVALVSVYLGGWWHLISYGVCGVAALGVVARIGLNFVNVQ